MTNIHQRTQATIHLDRLERNIRRVQQQIRPGTDLIAVVKGNCYGHGVAGLYETFRRCGVRHYAVATWEEGVALRQAGAAEEPILLLGDTWDEQLPQLIEHRLTPTIFVVETAQLLQDLAAAAGVVQPMHIKLDTGMNRIGFPAEESSVPEILKIAAMPNLRITGVFTHFARADELDREETSLQYQRFTATVSALRQAGVDIPMVHAANSATLLLRPQEMQLDAVRTGDTFYGLSPIDDKDWEPFGFEEILTWETYVVLVKTVPAGAQIGYGGTYVTEKPTRVATIPVGFVDGYSRRLSNRGYVMIHGQKAPILGRVCMDQFMVDVTEIPGVKRGDLVTLLGEGITFPQMAELADITVDEIACGITGRVPRVYVPQ